MSFSIQFSNFFFSVSPLLSFAFSFIHTHAMCPGGDGDDGCVGACIYVMFIYIGHTNKFLGIFFFSRLAHVAVAVLVHRAVCVL